METQDEKQKRKVHRSPSYPAFSLVEAISKAGAVYAAEKRTATTGDVIASHMGYSAAAGPGGRAVSALRQYGLIEETEGKYRLSDLGYTLVHYEHESAEWRAAVAEAARRPTLFRELLEEYPDGLPSDGTLRNNLLKREFNPGSIQDVVSIFRGTMELADSTGASYTESGQTETTMATASAPVMTEPGTRRSSDLRSQGQSLVPPTQRTPVGSEIPVAKDCVMAVMALGRVTQEGIEKLIAYLGLIKGSFPKEGEA
ncbi:MAG: hypothetical protein ABSG41_01035 [Bryobacteraceae bacterium]|jgi:hypothetical protein